MNPRRLIIWILALVVVGGVYYFSLHSQEKKEKAQEEASRLVELSDPLRVKSVELGGQNYAKAVRIERRDEQHRWQLTQPGDYPAEGVAVGALLSGLMEARSKKRLPWPEKPADFGLDPPRVKVTLTDRSGTSWSLLVGDLSPTKEYLYGAPASHKGLWMLEPRLQGVVNRTLLDLRDKRLLDFVPSDVTGLNLTWGGRKHELVRKAGGAQARWEFADGGQASTSQVESLLYKIHALESVDFLDQGIDLKAQGLEQPTGQIELTLDKGKKVGLILGGKAATGGERYARRLAGGPVMVAQEARLRLLETSRKDLAERRVLALDREKAVQLEIKGEGVNLVYSKEQGAWKRQQPAGEDKDPSRVPLFLWDIGDLKWERLLASDEVEKMGPPAWTIKVTQDKGEGKVVSSRLMVGKLPLKDGLIPAWLDGDSRHFAVSPEFGTKIPGAEQKKAARKEGKGE